MRVSGQNALNSKNLFGVDRARFLNILLLITGLGLIGIIPITQLKSLPQISWDILWPELIGLLILSVCYLINRTGKTLVSTVVFLLAVIGVITFYIYVRADDTILLDLRGISPLIAVAIIVAGMIIGSTYSFVTAAIGVVCVVTVAMLRLKPTIPGFQTPLDALSQMSVPICFLFMVAGLSWLFEIRFRALIRQLETQNQTLDTANSELAHRHEIEKLLSKRVDTLAVHAFESFQEQSSHSTEQINAVLDATSTIRQLEQISRLILDAGSKVNETAQDSMQVVSNGTNNLRDELAMLALISEQSQTTAHSMQELYEQAHQINQIIELITEIADETSLVALNATIEAAGAGQYGRRFAAVANEVQRLASRSRDAADQVQDVVKDISAAIEKATAMVQKGADETKEAMSGSRLMEQTLEEIVNKVNNTGVLSQQIFRSVEQQQQATAQVAAKMRAISALSQAVTKDGDEMRQNLEQLKEAIAIMQQTIPIKESLDTNLNESADSSRLDLQNLESDSSLFPGYLSLPFESETLQTTEAKQDEQSV